MGKKQEVLTELFQMCQERENYVFDNTEVKEVCARVGFGNPFDVTKLDNHTLLPDILVNNDYAVIHLGGGRHQFIKGIDKIYHAFEPITDYTDWTYRRSLLNEYNSSESNLLSVANNQRILHQFVFGEDREFESIDISQRPKTYFPHRTKTDFSYRFGTEPIRLEQIQIEVDLTIEYQGKIGVFEAKNGVPDSFAAYQIYHPFLYYYNARERLGEQLREIVGVYVVRHKEGGQTYLRLWEYTFNDPLDITSIRLVNSKGYRLIGEQG